MVVLPSVVSDGDVLIPTRDDGTGEISISYPWEDVFIDMDKLFSKEILDMSYTISHAEIMVMRVSLRDVKKALMTSLSLSLRLNYLLRYKYHISNIHMM